MGPLLRVPRHPVTLARFGVPTLLPAPCSPGCSAPQPPGRCSAVSPCMRSGRCTYPMSSAIGLGILTAGHRHGWPVAAGGSQSITDALAALLAALGGKIETGIHVRRSRRQLPPAA